jgi:hypothetical protein
LLLSETAPSGWDGLVFALRGFARSQGALPISDDSLRSAACGVGRHRGRGGEHRSATAISAGDAARRPRAEPNPGQQDLCRQSLKLPGRPRRRLRARQPGTDAFALPRAPVADTILWVVLWILPVAPHVW